MGSYDTTVETLQRCIRLMQETPPSLVLPAMLVLLGGSIASLYILLYLVAPVPRPPRPSEKTYTTVLPDGSISDPQPLPCWLDNHVARKNLARRKQPSKLLADVPIAPAEVFMSVVVPAYNEERRLGGMLEEAVEFLQATYGDAHNGASSSSFSSSAAAAQPSPQGATQRRVVNGVAPAGGSQASPARGWEILVVSDGSTDGTRDAALRFARDHQLEQYPVPVPGPWKTQQQQGSGGGGRGKSTHIPHGAIRVVSLEANRGKGGAVVHGMRHVRGEYVVFADADGASRFEDLGKLVEGVKEAEDGAARGVAIGSRAHLVGSEAVVKRSAIRNFLMHSFHLLLRLMTPPATSRIRDTQCGFKLFSRASLPYIVPYMHSEGWIFDVEMLMLAELGGIPMVEVAIGWKEVMGSKLNVLWDSLGMAWGLAILRLAWTMGVYRRQ